MIAAAFCHPNDIAAREKGHGQACSLEEQHKTTARPGLPTDLKNLSNLKK